MSTSAFFSKFKCNKQQRGKDRQVLNEVVVVTVHPCEKLPAGVVLSFLSLLDARKLCVLSKHIRTHFLNAFWANYWMVLPCVSLFKQMAPEMRCSVKKLQLWVEMDVNTEKVMDGDKINIEI